MMMTRCRDHILTENIWFVWSTTSYSGDKLEAESRKYNASSSLLFRESLFSGDWTMREISTKVHKRWKNKVVFQTAGAGGGVIIFLWSNVQMAINDSIFKLK